MVCVEWALAVVDLIEQLPNVDYVIACACWPAPGIGIYFCSIYMLLKITSALSKHILHFDFILAKVWIFKFNNARTLNTVQTSSGLRKRTFLCGELARIIASERPPHVTYSSIPKMSSNLRSTISQFVSSIAR